MLGSSALAASNSAMARSKRSGFSIMGQLLGSGPIWLKLELSPVSGWGDNPPRNVFRDRHSHRKYSRPNRTDPKEFQVTDLFSPARFGAIELANRVVMSSLTRNRAGAGNVPTPLAAEYYRQRASAGLILTEATPICAEGHGYPRTPGIHTPEQIAGWKQVTEAVHGAGGRIALQLWHVGRISHPDLQPGGILPVAPSAIRPAGQVYTGQAMKDFVTPRALRTD